MHRAYGVLSMGLVQAQKQGTILVTMRAAMLQELELAVVRLYVFVYLFKSSGLEQLHQLQNCTLKALLL